VKKRFKDNKSLGAPKAKATVAELIGKVERQLNAQLSAMDKKLDVLMSQSEKRPFEKNYSQHPPRQFNRPNRHDAGGRNKGPRERTFTRVVCADCSKECEIPFKPSGGRPVYCKDCFTKRRDSRLYIANPDERPTVGGLPQTGNFDKKHGRKRKKQDKENKPFYARRKKRT